MLSVRRSPPRSTPRFRSPVPSRSFRSRLPACTPFCGARDHDISFTVEVDPDRADFGFAVVPDLVLAAGAIGDEIALPQHMLGAVDLDGQFALQHKTIFEAVVADRMLGTAGVGSIFVDGNRDAAAAVLAQQPAYHVLRGLDLACLGSPHHDL